MAYGIPDINSSIAELYKFYSDDLCDGINGVLYNKNADFADCLRADARRFAAHKAHYVETMIKDLLNDERTPVEQRQINAERALQTFRVWGQTERNFAVQSTQMAEKWHNFEQDGDRYLLQYRTADDEKVREEHASLHGVTLPMDDPFWDEYYPPLGWNCRCTVVQVLRNRHTESDSNTAIDNGRIATEKTPSFRFNPGKKMKCFPDNVSYLKHAGQNRRERDKVEEKCEMTAQKVIRKTAKQSPLLQQSYPCEIDGEIREVRFAEWGISETAHSMLGRKNLYWLKNEVLNNPEKYFKNAKYISEAEVDLSHNTNKNRLRLKEHFIKYYYCEIELANREKAYLNIVKHDDGNFYLYTISRNITSY